ncbi:MAG: tetratricopeptide repeat protein [bacterium]
MPVRRVTSNPEIALDTLKLLMNTRLVDFDESEITALVEAEQNFLKAIQLPDPNVKMTEKVCADYEALLFDFLPTIPMLREKLRKDEFDNAISQAKKLAAVIDNKLNASTNYWTTLVDFLANADQATWLRWRKATFAEKKAHAAVRFSEYKNVKAFSLFGLKLLGDDIPDRRLYLHLCSRLQCGLAVGDNALGVANSLGAWVVDEAEKLRFHILAAGMAYNMGNQQIILGNADTDSYWLEKAKKISNRWKYIRNMEWFRVAVLERLAQVMLRKKEYTRMKELLEAYRRDGKDNRVDILYNQGMAAYYEYTGNLDEAENCIRKARDLAKHKKADGQLIDPYNAWASQVTLACIYEKSTTHKPEEAIAGFDEAKNFAGSIDGFLNDNRECSYHIFSARARLKMNDLDKVRTHLDRANELLQNINAPRHSVRRAILEAMLHSKNKQRQEARGWLDEAAKLCTEHLIIDYDDEIAAIRAAL